MRHDGRRPSPAYEANEQRVLMGQPRKDITPDHTRHAQSNSSSRETSPLVHATPPGAKAHSSIGTRPSKPLRNLLPLMGGMNRKERRMRMIMISKLGKALFLAGSMTAALAGCDPAPASSSDATEREPIGKADATAGTCEDRCGAPWDPAEACQCDEACSTFGDCCADFAPICEGEPEGITCEANEDCASGEYCEREPGCGTLGTCEPVPFDQPCAKVLTTYCDCDGNTKMSSDACVFEPIAHLGECEESPAGDEGAACELNADCTSGLFCDREIGCDAPGTCQPVPFGPICGQAITPYCDCEGNSEVSNTTCIFEPIQNIGECAN